MGSNGKKSTENGTFKDRPARPIKVIVDDQGEFWICDLEADAAKDLKSQGCVPCKGPAPARSN